MKKKNEHKWQVITCITSSTKKKEISWKLKNEYSAINNLIVFRNLIAFAMRWNVLWEYFWDIFMQERLRNAKIHMIRLIYVYDGNVLIYGKC